MLRLLFTRSTLGSDIGDDGEGMLVKEMLVLTVISLVNVRTFSTGEGNCLECAL